MKVLPVSFSFKGIQQRDNEINNYPFLYTANSTREMRKEDNNRFKAITASLALIAVAITLINIKGRKKLPDNIVEIADKNKGLNKLSKYEKTVQELKEKIIYPLKAVNLGDKNVANSKKLKSGLIITHNQKEGLEEITCGLMEHLKELGIETKDINEITTRVNNKGEKVHRNIRRNERVKWVYNQIQNAKKSYEEEGKYTVINLGDIGKLTDLKIIKSQKSNFEDMLSNLNGKTYPGVIWTGWTTKTNSVPLFYNDLPVLITRLTD
ncbi:unknown [Clostridium sp. CAG:967]|nr:unknown [Clostridium sp. CAG:967]